MQKTPGDTPPKKAVTFSDHDTIIDIPARPQPFSYDDLVAQTKAMSLLPEVNGLTILFQGAFDSSAPPPSAVLPLPLPETSVVVPVFEGLDAANAAEPTIPGLLLPTE